MCLSVYPLLCYQEQLKQRDQSLRKQEQEMDSLSFRNQQLAKRVELLQEELAASEAKGKKGKVIMHRIHTRESLLSCVQDVQDELCIFCS